MARPTLNYSKTRVRKAGYALRDWWDDGGILITPEIDEHLTVMENWRSCHAYSLLKAYVGLQSRCRTCGVPQADISQRLKRQPTIIDKLSREPSMALDRMQDIAGVRAVVPAIGDVRSVERRWAQSGGDRVKRTVDYVTNPKDSGYRGIHLIVDYDSFPVEVQLRTHIQHMWAEDVEKLSGSMGIDFKSGRGPAEVLEYLALASEAMSYEEQHESIPPSLADSVRYARTAALRAIDTLDGHPAP